VIALLLALASLPTAPDPLAARVEDALARRDSFCISLREPAPPPIFAKASTIEIGRIGVLLSNAEASHDPWFHLLRALYEKSMASSRAEMFLQNALFACGADVGALTALSLELSRQGEGAWALEAAAQADRQFLAQGGEASSLLEGLWREHIRSDPERAAAWKSRAEEVAGRAGASASVGDPRSVSATLKQAAKGCWRDSFAFFRQGSGILQASGLWLVALTILSLAIRHLPTGLHLLAAAPEALPARLRQILSWVIPVLTLGAGWAGLAWAILILTASHLRSGAERVLALIAALLLLSAPLALAVDAEFAAVDSRSGSFGELVAALDGIAAPGHGLAGTVTDLKSGNDASALMQARQALSQDSSTGFGWSLLAAAKSGSRDSAGARDAWQRSWSITPNAWAGSALSQPSDTPEEMRRQQRLAESYPDRPRIPQPSSLEMLRLFFADISLRDISGAPAISGFLPLKTLPWLGFGSMAAFLFALWVPWGKALRLEACPLCGRPTCQRCRQQRSCKVCAAKLSEQASEAERRQLRLELLSRRVMRRRSLESWGDLVLPGFGSLAAAAGPGILTVFVCIGTSIGLGLGTHSLLWVSQVEGIPTPAIRLWGWAPLALWLGLLTFGRRRTIRVGD